MKCTKNRFLLFPQVFPTVKPRRLGTRGNSRYCYAGLKKTSKLTFPEMPTDMVTFFSFLPKKTDNKMMEFLALSSRII